MHPSMATVAEAPDEKPNSLHNKSETLEAAAPWIDYAAQQARLLQEDVQRTVDSFAEASKSRLSQIISTSSAHFAQSLDLLGDVKAKYAAHEDIVFGKIKEGVDVAASHPMATVGTMAGLGLVLLKKPRSFLYYKTIRLIMSEEAMLSRAESKVKELRQSIDLLKAESQKLEKRAQMAEEEMIRGRTKLRQAGKQIQSVIGSAHKIERQAEGLKDILRELPRREASRFRSQVSKLESEAKRERNSLKKEVSKISDYGISV
ncbi:RGS1-HXK1-interacting protein 1 [Punica granatum]|uniref:RGS1-HXK1-interacting protein 1 n=2 Tax=Punica granatum TaxID=22663 RepID=A0A6P8DX72_PUNGR|nr:RGS1-HXK1-interacting protein 1 [Punica granatum]PKI42024.1 hypothetical protein CRG98_037586 [Punica granatum]